jgi:hypothetical protein
VLLGIVGRDRHGARSQVGAHRRLSISSVDLTMRPISGREELDLFCRIPYVLNAELAEDLAAGRRRPDWMWLALRGDRLVARLAWWGRADDNEPQILDVFDIDDGAERERVDVAVALLRFATEQVVPNGARRPEYSRFLSPGWHEDAVERQAVEDRMTALGQTSAQLLVERLRLEWRPPTPVAASTGRLSFRPANDRDEMARVLDGTLETSACCLSTGGTATSTTSSPKAPAPLRRWELRASGPPPTWATSRWRAFAHVGYVNFERQINMKWS